MSEKHLQKVLTIENASFSRPWTIRHFQDEIESPHALPIVAESPDGEVLGYLCPKVVLDEGEILDVAVAESARGKGIGRLLVEHALSWCRERGAAVVLLEVRVGNDSAIELYRRMGFTESGIRKRYYEDGSDALLMQRPL
ncbi:ribosomal protein S18-alanine N-acetyltransferase [Geomesophilobacter sediminis]|nr:ribosomal protein S18-alanine N-acetyltransferase [Geomesophilobacter sediminis]